MEGWPLKEGGEWSGSQRQKQSADFAWCRARRASAASFSLFVAVCASLKFN
jgi:hypothetical protein